MLARSAGNIGRLLVVIDDASDGLIRLNITDHDFEPAVIFESFSEIESEYKTDSRPSSSSLQNWRGKQVVFVLENSFSKRDNRLLDYWQSHPRWLAKLAFLAMCIRYSILVAEVVTVKSAADIPRIKQGLQDHGPPGVWRRSDLEVHERFIIFVQHLCKKTLLSNSPFLCVLVTDATLRPRTEWDKPMDLTNTLLNTSLASLFDDSEEPLDEAIADSRIRVLHLDCQNIQMSSYHPLPPVFVKNESLYGVNGMLASFKLPLVVLEDKSRAEKHVDTILAGLCRERSV
ncbi:hypothetical protein EIP91_003845 [Steccherinum ochraceum]|uniref:Uncharacterized protein n=1 Tax=Steccherinum ochraceum TaxID=92696 RepID=A0A4R0R9T2_9APHY|nr:hypothetical protein EIP91_003845 [Steccherinum ochraceum]